MSIRFRLLFLNIIVLTGLLLIIFTTFLTIRNIRELNGLVRRGLELRVEFQKYNDRSRELLSARNLEAAMSLWAAQGKKFDELYAGFSSSPVLLGLLSASGKTEELESFSFGLKEVATRQDETRKNLSEYVERVRAETGATTVPGVLVEPASSAESSRDTRLLRVMIVSGITAFADGLTQTLLNKIEAVTDEIVFEADTAERNLYVRFVTVGFCVAAFSFVAFQIFARRLNGRLRSMKAPMDGLKRGDFTVSFPARGKDELSEITGTLNGFVGNFSNVIDGVKSITVQTRELKNETTAATEETAAAITEMTAGIASMTKSIRQLVENVNGSTAALGNVSDGIGLLPERMERQSDFIRRSSASIEEINAAIRNVMQIAGDRESAAAELVELTKTGGSAIEETNAMIGDIASDVEAISEITRIIKNVAGSTNLLAMNAAIEAAHAGNAGRGFAVVAEEIRKLSDSTNENSRKISATVSGITAKIAKVVEKSDDSRNAFRRIDDEVGSTSGAMAEVVGAMKDLSSGSDEIMSAMNELAAIANSIHGETNAMKMHTESVLEGIRKIDGIGRFVMNGMEEIERGTAEISSAAAHVNDLQARTGDSIERLNEGVAGFKTGSDLQPVES